MSRRQSCGLKDNGYKGQYAEKIALAHLKKQGLTPITQNFRCRQGEIDLIMKHNETVVFIEVRYKKDKNYGSSVESININKQRKVVKSAIYFMVQKNWYTSKAMRFDVVGICGELDHQPQIQWIPQAFDWSMNEYQ